MITHQCLTSNYLSALNIYDPVASPSSLAIYILKVTDFYGCIDYDTIQVDVFANAVANAGNDIDTCANTSILLQASGTGMSSLIMFAMIFAVMYFFMIRPQIKKQKQENQYRESLKTVSYTHLTLPTILLV